MQKLYVLGSQDTTIMYCQGKYRGLRAVRESEVEEGYDDFDDDEGSDVEEDEKQSQ